MSLDAALPRTPNLPTSPSLPPLSNFRVNALTRQKRCTNLRAFRRHLDPFFEDTETFYDSGDNWDMFDMSTTRHVEESEELKALRLRRSRFERSVALRDSRRRTAARLEKRKLSKSESAESQEEDDSSWKLSRSSSMRSSRSKAKRVTTVMGAISEVPTDSMQFVTLSGSPYRMSSRTKRMVESDRRHPAFKEVDGNEEKSVKDCGLNLPRRSQAEFTIEHHCTNDCRCECSTPSSSSQPSEVDVGTRHRRCTSLKQAPRNALRPQLSLPLRLSNVTNGADEELAGAVGGGSVRRKSRNCRDEGTLSTSLTASEGGDQLAASSEQRPPAGAAGSAECVPDFGALSDGLILPETNASRDMKIFKRVLRDPKLRQPFQLFLEQQFCAENLNFYVAVERFRDMQFNNESKASERASFARHIYERHFAANSTEPVNVDNSTSKRIRETMQGGKYPRNTFDLAQYQIFHLLKYDCWPRFLRAGGVQPEFSDEELAEEDERQHRLDIGAQFVGAFMSRIRFPTSGYHSLRLRNRNQLC
ncbi:hypothetical protein Y032_0136g1981 [Ancylostoma ceylanicum]|uniref:RGS domain-containing protein n=1 Tax=Ancylostoma ceylanicum TaxID=53326 RepID=A0A016T5C8_9BILA|nr:hypothetical protein Y032_0136g1981 [Ancylostoma ceylanicum]